MAPLMVKTRMIISNQDYFFVLYHTLIYIVSTRLFLQQPQIILSKILSWSRFGYFFDFIIYYKHRPKSVHKRLSALRLEVDFIKRSLKIQISPLLELDIL